MVCWFGGRGAAVGGGRGAAGLKGGLSPRTIGGRIPR